ncbi:MAG: type IV pilin N-terminal domain-containing protein [Halodesulfurarchaeum sp.]|nr:type IV pilin N-terminal domain-containing protein [Halodesulfurarchaeum sp.]
MTRAITPVFGTLLLATITVALAAILVTTVGTAALGGPVGTGGDDLAEFTRLSVEAGPDGEVILTHEAGDSIDVSEVTVSVAVDGTPLENQPPVPFFSTTGFEAGPTGPFNSASDPEWTVGETASFAISDSNDPVPRTGDEVTVEVLRDGRPIAQASATVSGGGP